MEVLLLRVRHLQEIALLLAYRRLLLVNRLMTILLAMA
jgi:hypothetical protein